ncbi:expressed unknown protein [Seminavis robusta]|uniref:Uncharacterized protein n=1 Tax=Seminavis robusta TaxID=568900 RepID=A0A9N8E644_9STRA|nr:expressed unknown protein [Seminavis robusta]|eukprot:Sro692_g188170.1 n/a (340) ;mRNA; f:45735-46754
MDNENFSRKAVSRRGGDSTKRTTIATASTAPSARAQSPAAPKSRGRQKKIEDHGIEMRPLLFKGGVSTINSEESTSPTAHNASSPVQISAKQFADSWLGNYVKLKAKQAEKHAYNFKASLKSKKGFHVQVPKRMLFYTSLVFLFFPLVLFMYKENHIHDNDPAFQAHKRTELHSHGSNWTSNHNHTGVLLRKRQDRQGSSNNKNTNNHQVRGRNHPSLQQLLAGGLPTNTTSKSRSAPGPEKKSQDTNVEVREAAVKLETSEKLVSNATLLPVGENSEVAVNTEATKATDAVPKVLESGAIVSTTDDVISKKLPVHNTTATTQPVNATISKLRRRRRGR